MNIHTIPNNRGSPTIEKASRIFINISSRNTLKEKKMSLKVNIAEIFTELMRLRL